MQFSPAAGLLLASFLSLTGCGLLGTSKEQYLQRGNEFAAKEQFVDATLNYRNALKKDPAFAEAHYRFGLLLIKTGPVTDAFTSLERAVELKPDHEEARLALAKLYLEGLNYLPSPPQALYDRLLRIAEGFLKADPKSFHGHRLFGHVALLDGKPAAAVEHFRSALTAKPDSAEAAALLAQSLISDGKVAEAGAFAEKTLAAYPTHGALYDILYYQYRNTGRVLDAEALLQKRIATSPKESIHVIQLARHHLSLRQAQQMEDTLQRLTDPKSGYPDGFLAAGNFLRDIGDLPRAIDLFQRGRQVHPEIAAALSKHLVEAYLQSKKPREATALLEELLRENPADQEAISARASILAASSQISDVDSAIVEFTKLTEKYPQNVSYLYDLARVLQLRGREADARSHLLKAIQVNPNHLLSLEALAATSIKNARAQEALNYASRALALNSQLPATRLVYSAALALQGKTGEARQEINKLIREYPNLQEAHLQLALLNIEEKRFPEAEAIYRSYYKPGLKDSRLLRGLVALSFAAGRPERALLALQEEVKLQPTSYEARIMLATTAAEMNKPALASEHFQWLKQNNPPSARLEMAIGLLHQQAGEWPAAIRQLEAARKLAPKDSDVSSALAFALQQAGRAGEAVALYQEALQSRPGSLVIMNNLAMAIADSGGDLTEALRLAQAAASKDLTNPKFSDALGLVYQKRKDLTNAAQAFRSTVAKAPDTVEYRIHLASALLDLGDKAGAQNEVASALTRKPSAAEMTEIRKLEARLAASSNRGIK